MEYVEGLPITDHCDERRLTIEQRLRLFQQVCEAVQHAHQKGIIHRNFKPSNILVAARGDKPIPKIINLGVAKALRESGIEHIGKTIREADRKTPSTRLTKLGEEAKKVAESRRTEVAALAKCLYKELEWIPLKAMRKDRSEHYRSASELADDIENYLKGAP